MGGQLILMCLCGSSANVNPLCRCCQVAGCMLSSPQRYHGSRSNSLTVSSTSQHYAGKFRPESPTLEDYVVIRHSGHAGATADGCLITTGHEAGSLSRDDSKQSRGRSHSAVAGYQVTSRLTNGVSQCSSDVSRLIFCLSICYL